MAQLIPPHGGKGLTCCLLEGAAMEDEKKKAAEILKVRRATLSDLLHGKSALTPDMAEVMTTTPTLPVPSPASHDSCCWTSWPPAWRRASAASSPLPPNSPIIASFPWPPASP